MATALGSRGKGCSFWLLPSWGVYFIAGCRDFGIAWGCRVLHGYRCPASGASFNFQSISGMRSLEETPSSLGTESKSLSFQPCCWLVAGSSFGVKKGNFSAQQWLLTCVLPASMGTRASMFLDPPNIGRNFRMLNLVPKKKCKKTYQGWIFLPLLNPCCLGCPNLSLS